jgi:hypothetical protein
MGVKFGLLPYGKTQIEDVWDTKDFIQKMWSKETTWEMYV